MNKKISYSEMIDKANKRKVSKMFTYASLFFEYNHPQLPCVLKVGLRAHYIQDMVVATDITVD